MKLHLPIRLRCALVAACCFSAFSASANVADVVDTVKDYTGTPSYPAPVYVAPIYVGTDTEIIKEKLLVPATTQPGGKGSIYLRPAVYDVKGNLTDGDAIISSYGSKETPVTIKTSLYVREGTLTIADSYIVSDLSAGQYYAKPNFYPGLYQPAFQVSGKNAKLVFDGVSFMSSPTNTGVMKKESDMVSVGGRDGAGTMIITGGSDVHIGTSLLVGSQKFGGPYGGSTLATRNDCDDTTGRYEGEYVDDDGDGIPDERGAYNQLHSNKIMAEGTFILEGGSKLELGGGLNAGEGTVILSGQGTVMTTCTQLVNGPSSGEEGLDLVARNSGSYTTIRVEKGAQWYSNSSLLTAAYDAFESKATITVDGEGSLISVKNALNLGWGSKKYSPQHSGSGGTVAGSTELYITNGGRVNAGSIILGVPKDRGGANPVYVGIDSSSELATEGNMAIYSAFGADGHTKALFNGKEVPSDFKCEVYNEGSIKAANLTLNGGNLHNSGTIDVSGTLTLASGNLTMGLSQKHNTQAAITAGTVKVATADGSDYEVLVTVKENLKAGKYMLLDVGEEAETASTYSRAAAAPGKVKFILPEDINGMSLVMDEEGNAILTLSEQVLLTLDPLANAVQAANWGVQKSSQAFTSLLWQPRSAAAEVRTDSVDSKGMSVPAAPSSRTVAWGSAYSGFSSLSTSGNFCGADYSLYGGAIGVERQCAKGSSIGVALGYDWGKTSPHAVSRVNQDTMHAALYGRALNRKLGSKSSVALDWSAAVGNTTSEHDQLGSDWEQKSMQLDARATYGYELTNRTTLSGFAGAQYYAQESASTSRIHASSMQNLRLMLGGGVSYKATERTTLYGEATIYNDTMRHNPTADLDGFYYGNGTNPGRLGGSISVGAQYQLNDKWSINGNYTYEGADNSDEQRVNVGASYTF